MASARSVLQEGEWQNVRCEGADCRRHRTVFRMLLKPNGDLVIQVKCSSCNHVNEIETRGFLRRAAEGATVTAELRL